MPDLGTSRTITPYKQRWLALGATIATPCGSLIDSPKPELDGKAKKQLRGKEQQDSVLAGPAPENSTQPRK